MSETSPLTLSEETKTLPFLVVESDDPLRNSLVGALTAAGVQSCAAAANGAEAWQEWKQKKELGVIISAWNLPEMPGLDFLRRIRADKMARTQPTFVLMADEEEPGAAEKAVGEGADCFVVKPFPAEKIIALVNEGVAHRRQGGAHGSFTQSTIESRILNARPTAQLIFERYSSEVECEQLLEAKCVLRVKENYGLGTVLTVRFAHPESGGGAFYRPLKGIVTKIERVPRDYGMFRLHLELRGPIRAHHGVADLLAAGGIDSGEK